MTTNHPVSVPKNADFRFAFNWTRDGEPVVLTGAVMTIKHGDEVVGRVTLNDGIEQSGAEILAVIPQATLVAYQAVGTGEWDLVVETTEGGRDRMFAGSAAITEGTSSWTV